MNKGARERPLVTVKGTALHNNPSETLSISEIPASMSIIQNRAGAALGNGFGASRSRGIYFLHSFSTLNRQDHYGRTPARHTNGKGDFSKLPGLSFDCLLVADDLLLRDAGTCAGRVHLSPSCAGNSLHSLPSSRAGAFFVRPQPLK